MEKYKIKIFPAAQRDLKDIVDYINTLSPQAAFAHYDAIVADIAALRQMPERFAVCKDLQLRLRQYRTMPVKNYLVFYVINGDSVEIRRILYARRQYGDLL